MMISDFNQGSTLGIQVLDSESTFSKDTTNVRRLWKEIIFEFVSFSSLKRYMRTSDSEVQ